MNRADELLVLLNKTEIEFDGIIVLPEESVQNLTSPSAPGVLAKFFYLLDGKRITYRLLTGEFRFFLNEDKEEIVLGLIVEQLQKEYNDLIYPSQQINILPTQQLNFNWPDYSIYNQSPIIYHPTITTGTTTIGPIITWGTTSISAVATTLNDCYTISNQLYTK